MSSSRFPTTAMPQSNTTREFSSVSAAVVLLLLLFLSTKAPNRIWRRLLSTFTRHWDSIRYHPEFLLVRSSKQLCVLIGCHAAPAPFLLPVLCQIFEAPR